MKNFIVLQIGLVGLLHTETMKKLILLICLYPLAGFAQCPDSVKCDGTSFTFYFTDKPNGLVKYLDLGIDTVDVTNLNNSIVPYSLTTTKGTLSCSDTASKIGFLKANLSTVGVGCNTQFPVPVELLYFRASSQKILGEAIRDKRNIMIEWATASEYNADRFEVWKYGKGIIHVVKAQGNSNQLTEYCYVDKAGNGYQFYQIIQYDYDGTEHRGRIIFVRGETPIQRALRRYNVIGQEL